jgi:hypothetical protein
MSFRLRIKQPKGHNLIFMSLACPKSVVFRDFKNIASLLLKSAKIALDLSAN